jgi:hypothetical protein
MQRSREKVMYLADENMVVSKGGLKATWQQLQPPVKIGIVALAVVVGLVFVLRVLPYLLAAMGIGMLLAVLFIPYWIPTIVAFVRKHPSKGAILALNMFFGWTFVGWVLSLVWALSSPQTPTTIVINNSNSVLTGSAPQSPPQIGDIMDGRRFNGISWVPLQGHATPAASLPDPQYRVGDVVNGHRFDGARWVPVEQTVLPAQPQPPGLPPA